MIMNKNKVVVKFNMDAEDYKAWKAGKDSEVKSQPHAILNKSFKSVLEASSKFAPFQHLKNDYVEVEIEFNESAVLNLIK